jgi:hypothetical protein
MQKEQKMTKLNSLFFRSLFWEKWVKDEDLREQYRDCK